MLGDPKRSSNWTSSPKALVPALSAIDSVENVSLTTPNGGITSACLTPVGKVGLAPQIPSTSVAANTSSIFGFSGSTQANSFGSIPATGRESPLNTQPTLKGHLDAILLYMKNDRVFYEEKKVVFAILAALSNYTKARIYITQQLDEGEVCIRQISQLHNSINIASTKINSSSPSGLTDSFVSQQQHQQQLLAGATFSTANLQRGRAKVDMDLAECRGMLQQVETLVCSFQEIQKTRARVLKNLGWKQEAEGEEQRPKEPAHLSGSEGASMAVPVSLLHITLDDCMMQMRQVWDTTIIPAVKDLCTKIHGYSNDTVDVCNAQVEPAENGLVASALLQLCDSTLDRVETMRSRITRLGSSRIEEAESLERLLASLDNYDPAAEEHAKRRKQIDTELDGLRGWLGHIGQLRQRTMAQIEVLKQSLVGAGESIAGSRRASPCPSFGGNGGSALSSHRPSSTGPGSNSELYQAPALPDEGEMEATSALLWQSSQPPALSSNITHETGGSKIVGDALGFPTAVPPPSQHPPLVIANNASNMGSDGNQATERYAMKGGDNRASSSSGSSGEKEKGALFDRNSKKRNNDISDGRLSEHVANTFDTDEPRRRRQRRCGGYLNSIKAFTKAIVRRASRFSDSEDESTDDDDYYYDDDDDDDGVGREGQRRRVE